MSGKSDEKRWGDTTSKKGEISRVFIGNIDSYKTTVSDLRESFFLCPFMQSPSVS